MRAAEDGRTGPLPTLAEAIAAVTESMSGDAGGEEMKQGDAVTRQTQPERVGGGWWFPKYDKPSAPPPPPPAPPRVHRGSDVFDANGDEVPWEGVVAILTAERDAAIRERDEIRQSWLRSEESGTRLLAERNAALDAADGLRKRVAELEAASGGGEREPDAWGVVRDGNVESVTHRRFRADADRVAEQWGETVVPLYRSPPPPRGWLTGEERRFVHWWAHEDRAPTDEELDAFKIAAKALLSRSSPPEVVKPVHRGAPEIRERDSLWIRALAAAGVAVKEVGK